MKLKYILFFFLLPYCLFGQTKKVDSLKNLIENTPGLVMKSFTMFLLFFIIVPSFGQENKEIKNGIHLFNKSTKLYKKAEFDSAYVFGKKSLEIFKKQKNDSLIAEAACLMFSVTKGPNNKDEKFSFYNLSEQKALKTKNWELLSLLYLKKGDYHYNNIEDDLAMRYYLKSDSLLVSRKINNKTRFNNLIQITNLILYSGQKMDSIRFKKAKNYIDESLLIAKKIDYPNGESEAIKTYASLLSRNGRHLEAQTLLNEALQIALASKDIFNESSIYWRMASNYLVLKKNDSAEVYYKKRVKIFENTNHTEKLALAYSGLGAFYKKTNQFKKGIYYQSKALEMYKQVSSNTAGQVLGTMNGLANAYAGNKDYKEAYDLQLKAYNYNDSLTNNKNQKVTLELETKYQTEKKEQEIALLESENKIIEQQRKSQRNLLLGGLGITTVAGVLFFILFRNRKKTAAKLKELDTVKSNFFANISHEFRTPLTLITQPIDAVLEDDAITGIKRQQFKTAKRNSDRLLALVNQLLDLSKIDAGQLQLKIQQSNATQLIAALGDSFSYAATQKNINYHVDVNQNIEDVYFDRDALEKIVVNLLSNAIKYTPEHGTVALKAFIKNEILHITVENSGKGLTDSELNYIFKRFYQTQDQNQGTGIGLALVKELVDLHKGTIQVESTPSISTTFTVTLPVDKQSFKNETFITARAINEIITPKVELSNTIESEETINQEFPILLLVEDNDDVRLLLKQTFESFYTIITAVNGQEGITAAIEHIPDLIISDVMMPITNGIELTKHLKHDERTSHIPIILLTAKAGDHNELIGVEVGADDYITKPFNSKILKTKVSKLIENRRLLQERFSQELILLPTDVPVTNVDVQFLEKIQTIFDTNLLESSFSALQFSEAVGMSRMQLHRKLKALTGLSTSEFIRVQRLKLAVKLIKTSDISISQIGYSVGFNAHSYFAKCFKTAYDCTPTEYAKKHRKS